MQTAFTSLSELMSPQELKTLIETNFKDGDQIHISTKVKKKLYSVPAIFKGIYNRFIRIETPLNEQYNTINTISLSDLYIGNTIIHELIDIINEEKCTNKWKRLKIAF